MSKVQKTTKTPEETVISVSLSEAHECTVGINAINDIKLPFKTGYWIGRLNDMLNPLIKQASSLKDKAAEEYGNPLKGRPGQFTIPAEKVKAYNEAIDNIMNIRENIKIKKFTEEDFKINGQLVDLPSVFMKSVGLLFIEEPKESKE